MNKFIEYAGAGVLIIIAAVVFVTVVLIGVGLGVAITTFIGWFMGLAASWLFGAWLESGVQQLLGVDMTLDLIGAVLGFLFGIARLGIAAAKTTVEKNKNESVSS